MNLDYVIDNIFIKEKWFSLKEDNVYKKIGYKGFYLYLSLFKFRSSKGHKNENIHRFIFSISLLRKETGYSSECIFDYLKLFKKSGIIRFTSVSRWEYLLDENNKIRDKDVIVCETLDYPCTHIENNNDVPDSNDDRYISVNLSLLDLYLKEGLNEKYFGIYCLLKFYGGINKSEGKSSLKIETIADCLGIHKDTAHKMIKEMNKKYFLWSYKRGNKKKGYKFEHHIIGHLGEIEKLRKYWKKNGCIEKNIEMWKKRD